MSNPFKIIEPSERPPEQGRDELMGSIGSVVLILRFVQLFMADSTAVMLNKFKINTNKNDQD